MIYLCYCFYYKSFICNLHCFLLFNYLIQCFTFINSLILLSLGLTLLLISCFLKIIFIVSFLVVKIYEVMNVHISTPLLTFLRP